MVGQLPLFSFILAIQHADIQPNAAVLAKNPWMVHQFFI